jgi:Cu2+-exporting ATPase
MNYIWHPFIAGCLSEDKPKEIQRLQAEGKIVAMAWWWNDNSALARADIEGWGQDIDVRVPKQRYWDLMD